MNGIRRQSACGRQVAACLYWLHEARAAKVAQMKVVHIITRMILGGAQENTLLTVEDQHHLWHDEVTLITGPAIGPEGSLIERARARELDVRLVTELRRQIHPLRDWQSCRRLRALLCQIKPQIVHTHSSKAGILGRAVAHRLGIPVVHTVHGSPFHPYQNRIVYEVYRRAERWAARRCDLLISVCDAMTDQYVAAGVAPREKFVTVYSGMEVDPFINPPRPREAVRRELGFDPEHIVVGKVARLFELKGHEYVIAAARTVVARNDRVRFLFVGDGLLRERLKEDIAKAGLARHFVFTGLVAPERIPELIAAMDIVVHASLREGLARVLPQALIGGKPIVSYDIDGAREVVLPGETGFLLPPRSVVELADAIVQLANDPDMRHRFGQNGRAKFIDQFRHETMTKRLREIYERVLAKCSGSGERGAGTDSIRIGLPW
jgi:glycosyltransferase involved in cell wall biosynthesis